MIDIYEAEHYPGKTLWCVSFELGSRTRMFTSELLANGFAKDVKSGKIV